MTRLETLATAVLEGAARDHDVKEMARLVLDFEPRVVRLERFADILGRCAKITRERLTDEEWDLATALTTEFAEIATKRGGG